MSFFSNHLGSSMFSAMRTPILIVAIASLLVLSTGDAGGQTVEDDHGDSYDTATLIELGSSLSGSIDPGDDRDVFKIDLSEATGETDLWVYTHNPDQDVPFDTFGGLYDSAGTLVELSDDGFLRDSIRSFSIRSIVPPGVYYVIVVGYSGDPGDYTFYAQAVSNPGSTIETAKPLVLGSRDGGRIDTLDDTDYFKLDFTEAQHVIIDARSSDISPLDAVLLDSDGEEISSNFALLRLRGLGTLFPLGFDIEEDFEPGTYYLKVTSPFAPESDEEEEVDEEPLPFRSNPYAVFFLEDLEYTELLDDCKNQTNALSDPQINDPLYACQWHLSSPVRQDINLGTVWADGVKGEGINVAVVDDGMYHAHEDLQGNVNTDLNFDYGENEDIYDRFEHYGTHVSGIIAARDNDIGVRGVAPRSTVYGYNFLGGRNSTIFNLLNAMTRNAEETAVSNNSWGWTDGPGFSPSLSFFRQAIRYGTTLGYDGKGVFYVFAAGNGHLLGDDSNLEEYGNEYGVTAACSVNKEGTRAGYSEMGANLWVCAPSNDRPINLGGVNGILTTENSDRYYHDFGGTSAAAPMVSGVAALTRDANPELTWRDIKVILAASAQKNDPASPGWDDGAPLHPVSSAENYSFNHEYGFGVVNAEGGVDLAKRWTNLPPSQNETVFSGLLNVTIPDATSGGEPSTFTHTLTVDSDISFTEFVEVTLIFEHDSFRDLEILLESPSGAISRIAVPFNTFDALGAFFGEAYVPLYGSFQFGSAKHLGEDPDGEWKLHVTDRIPSVDGTFVGFGMTVYGHERAPGVPTVDSVEVHPGGGMLNVAWSAPAEAGDSDITSYDIRYIPADAEDTRPTNWTLLEGVRSATTGGELEYTVTELADDTLYNLQVRAVNGSGASIWSEAGSATTRTSLCVIEDAVRDITNDGLIHDCEALIEARDTLAGDATLNWSTETDISTWDGVYFGGEPQRVTELIIRRSELNGSIPASLGRLDMLVELNLHSNELTGSIPAEIGDLEKLENLLLHNNELTGTIADLSSLSNLKMLYLSGNDMGAGQGIPAWLTSMSNLEYLSLWGNRLGRGIPDLSGMTSLKLLKLQQTGLTGEIPASMGDMVSLGGLYLHGNNLRGEIPEELGQLTNLRRIWLHSNNLTGEIPSELSGMTGLVDLNLRDNRLSGPIPAELGSMTNLEKLRLHNNQLSGSIPAELGDLDSLEGLWLQGNRLSGSIPAELGDLGDTLTQWRLGGNRLSGCVPAGLAAVADNDMAALGLQACP